MKAWKFAALLGTGGLLLQTAGCATMLADWFLNALVNALVNSIIDAVTPPV